MRQLLRVAKKTVPAVEWKRTPVLFRATAGLRLLPPAKALALLEEVQLALGAARTAEGGGLWHYIIFIHFPRQTRNFPGFCVLAVIH